MQRFNDVDNRFVVSVGKKRGQDEASGAMMAEENAMEEDDYQIQAVVCFMTLCGKIVTGPGAIKRQRRRGAKQSCERYKNDIFI